MIQDFNSYKKLRIQSILDVSTRYGSHSNEIAVQITVLSPAMAHTQFITAPFEVLPAPLRYLSSL